jgi:transposase
VKKLAESALSAISAELDGLYARTGRPSIPPERLLKAQLLIAFYSVRSDRQFCEQLDYNLLFRWFLDLDLESGGLDQSNFSRLRERLVETDIARRFFDEVVRLARKDKLLSSDHFTVDGTLIDAWASFKSFKRKDDDEPPKPGDGTGMVDFKGEKRSNATHQSTTDPDAKLMRKATASRPSSATAAMPSWRTAAVCAWICSSPTPPWPSIRRPANCSPVRGAGRFTRRPWVPTRATT